MVLERSVHAAADRRDPDLASWNPGLSSPDMEILPEWETLTARTREQVRNNGVASGAVQTAIDRVIGTGLRLVCKPDYKALGLSREWAEEWSRHVEARWRLYANDIDNYCDASRRLDFAGLLAQAYRSYMLSSSEILATIEWLPRRPDKYATAIQMIQPDRLSNPWDIADTDRLRRGVELAEYGVAQAYHIRQAHPSEVGLMGSRNAYSWQRVPAFTPWGRRRVIHVFEQEQPGQTRGKPGFVSVLAEMRVLSRFKRAALEAAIANAMYAAVIESEMPTEDVAAALGGSTSPMKDYLKAKNAFNQENGYATLNGLRVPHLVPGEKFRLLAAEHPTASYAEFEAASLRHLAAGFNMSYEEVSRDYSKTNMSAARVAMNQAWRFFAGRRHHIANKYATQIYAAWLEEAFDRADVEMPAGAPGFIEAKTAWCGCEWIGAPKGHVDELKERQAGGLAYGMYTTSLKRLCAEQGDDWEEVLEQRAYELKRMRELELDPAQPLEVGRRAASSGPKIDPDDGGAGAPNEALGGAA